VDFFPSDKRQPLKIPVYVSEIGTYIYMVCSIAIASMTEYKVNTFSSFLARLRKQITELYSIIFLK